MTLIPIATLTNDLLRYPHLNKYGKRFYLSIILCKANPKCCRFRKSNCICVTVFIIIVITTIISIYIVSSVDLILILLI